MDFRILGPLEVIDAERPVVLGGGKQRAVLAVLLLHANEVVPSERLIDELWGEAPPATAAKSVQVYVSQLRKALRDNHGADGRDGPLLTRTGGYVLRVGAGELDLDRFERALDEGRRALERDAPERAAERLRDALALWRGRPLQDFSYEPFAQAAIARLEELRLVALEARIEADLARGRHAEVAGELEALVAAHPLRERLRGQLMLALYRCDRQADALDAYRDGRRRLVDELGLEPSPSLQRLEAAILAQSPELAAPERGASPQPSPRPRRAPPARPPPSARLARHRIALLGAGAAALAVAGGAAAAQLLSSSGESRARERVVTPLRFNALASVALRGDAVRSVVAVPGRLGRVAVGAGSVWVGSDDARTVSSVNPRTGRVTRTLPAGVFPNDLAADRDAVWVVDGARRVVARVQPAYGRVTARVSLPRTPRERAAPADRFSLDPTSIAVGARAVWVSDGSPRLVRIDPRTLGVTAPVRPGGAVSGVAVGAGAVWAITSRAMVTRIDPRTNRVTDRIRIAGRSGPDVPYPIAVAAGAGHVWVLSGNTATVTKIDPRTAGVVDTTRVGVDRGPTGIAAGADGAWVSNADGTLSRIDEATGDVSVLEVGRGLRDVTVGFDAVWVTNQDTRCCGQE